MLSKMLLVVMVSSTTQISEFLVSARVSKIWEHDIIEDPKGLGIYIGLDIGPA